MSDRSTHSKLQHLHDALVADLENFRDRLPADVDEISEAYERYVRIIALLIQTLEKLLRIDAQNKINNRSLNDVQTRRDIISQIEHRLAQGTKNERSKGNP